MHHTQQELHEAQDELAALMHLPLNAWAEQVHAMWPKADESSEANWVGFVLAVVGCRLATQAADPTAAVAATRQLTDARNHLKGTIYTDRAGDIWTVVMEVEEADDSAVLLVASEEIAAAARRLIEREPMYRPVLWPLTASVNDQIESARQRLAQAEREAEGVLVQLRIAVATSVRHVESPFLTLPEAALYSRLEPGTISNAIYRGQLKKQSGSRKVVIRRDELDRFLNAQPDKKRRPRRGK